MNDWAGKSNRAGREDSRFDHCTAQWCVFNNYSLDRHRHQLWQHFSFDKLNNKLALNFASINHKNQKWPFLMDFFNLFFSPKPFFFWEKKNHFLCLKRKIFQRYILIPKFQEIHFCFTDPFAFKTLGVRVWPLSFFLMKEN